MEHATHARQEAEPLSLIVLAHDEAENVATVLDEILAWLDEHEPDAELIFVDDGSSDNTAAAAENALAGRNARIVRHPRKRGIGAAIRTGTVTGRRT